MPDPIPPPIPEGAPLPVEETPEIPMPPPPPPPPAPKGSFFSTIGMIIVFIGLFGAGIWLSSFVRQLMPKAPATETQIAPTAPATTPADPLAGWKTYDATSGVSFKLPPEVLSPICDTTTCMSQGTYLPGGTRFTVAPRGAGQPLTDFRGSAISDAGGIVFTTRDATVSAHAAKEFTGVFSGKTVSGYGFTQMRGYMIEVTPTLSLELNHFTPSGVTADFAADDTLFDQIVGTLILPATESARQAIGTQ